MAETANAADRYTLNSSYACHCFNRSRSSNSSCRFFSNRIAALKISMPKAMRVTYHSHSQLKLTDAVQIIVSTESSRNAEPRKRKARTRSINPAATPITDMTASAIINQGESLAPLMKMSEVEET